MAPRGTQGRPKEGLGGNFGVNLGKKELKSEQKWVQGGGNIENIDFAKTLKNHG